MVVNYRELNNLTRKDDYAIPQIEDTFTRRAEAQWLSVPDLRTGYYQVPVETVDWPKTSFTTPFSNWQFKVMPRRLINAPAPFQQMMENVVHC